MDNFDLLQKTRILFGKGEENHVGNLIKEFSNNCLIVDDGGDYLNELLQSIKKSLEENGISWYELANVKANPVYSTAKDGIDICRNHNIGFVLAVGGGSVMDTAKFISYTVNCPNTPFDLTPEMKAKHKVLPHGTVVTLSGTSSELSDCAMMIDDEHQPLIKYCLVNRALQFDFAIINSELTYTLPKKQMVSGAIDTISHALEVYFAQVKEEPLVEGYLESVIRTTLDYTPKAVKDPTNYDLRSVLSLCAMMAYHSDLANGGVPQDWGGHNIENPVTTRYNGIHGQTLGIITPSFMRYVYKKNPRPFVNFSTRCLHVNSEGKNDSEIVDEGAKKLEEWLKSMDMPIKFHEIGITYDMLVPCADIAVPAGSVYQLSKEEVLEIYKMAV